MGKKSLVRTALLQALGIILYCSFVAVVFWKGSSWFGTQPSFFAPFLLLLLFSVSVLVCGLIVFGQAYLLFRKKQTKEALKLLIYTAGWLMAFSLLTLFYIIIY